MPDEKQKWDIKQLGIGGGSVLGLLFMFQNQGIDLMTERQQASTQVVIEKTMANSNRIELLEKSVSDLNSKIDDGFDSLRDSLREDFSSVDRTIRELMGERWTRSDHKSFSQDLDSRLNFIERRLQSIESKKEK